MDRRLGLLREKGTDICDDDPELRRIWHTIRLYFLYRSHQRPNEGRE